MLNAVVFQIVVVSVVAGLYIITNEELVEI